MSQPRGRTGTRARRDSEGGVSPGRPECEHRERGRGTGESGESGWDPWAVQGLAGHSEGSGFYPNIWGWPLKVSE